MKCIIAGIDPKDYVNKNGTPVKGLNLLMLAENPNVYGHVFKETFISADSPVYVNNRKVFEDMDSLNGREVHAEWDVEQYGQKSVKRLINFEFTDKFYDLVERSEKVSK